MAETPHAPPFQVLVRIVAQDFVQRIVEKAFGVDYLVYMYFPGRHAEVDDTHARAGSSMRTWCHTVQKTC